jgi:glycosyltransferase involved in cell wall biosynthesis
MIYKVGILATHPIQYQVPWFRALDKQQEVDLTVFYCMLPNPKQQGDGFGVEFQWDVPLLEGYEYEVFENTAAKPSVTQFLGCDTPGIYNIVSNNGFDAFIVNGWVVKSCIQLLRACRKYNVPCIVRGESNALQPRLWWKRAVHRRLFSNYSAFLNIGKANKDFYLQNGVDEEKIFFAPYCVENERFQMDADTLRPEHEDIRARWAINPSAYTFLFCAKFIEKKRPLDLLQAFANAFKTMESAGNILHLLMVGDGHLRVECKRFVTENRLPVTFTGFLNQSEIASAYLASDCVVLPSDYGETWGLVVNEAMACGLPAIVSDRVGCHLDLVSPNHTGAVFPFADTHALSNLLISFASEPERSRAMGHQAKNLVARYSIEEVVKGTVDAIKYVCSNNAK